jgi:hypothetical protein
MDVAFDGCKRFFCGAVFVLFCSDVPVCGEDLRHPAREEPMNWLLYFRKPVYIVYDRLSYQKMT